MFRTASTSIAIILCLAAGSAWTEDKTPTENHEFPSIEGTWMLAIPMPGGIENPALKIRQRDGKLKATLKGRQGSKRLKNFSFKGSSFAFEQILETPKGDMSMKFRGSVQGDRIQGVIELPMGILPFTGKRKLY